jgi:hypothetical protein
MLDVVLAIYSVVHMSAGLRSTPNLVILAWFCGALLFTPCAYGRVLHPLPGQYEQPPAVIADLLEAAPLPAVAIAPSDRYLILVHESGLLPLERLAAPLLELGNLRVDPTTQGRTLQPIIRAIRSSISPAWRRSPSPCHPT